MKYVLVLGDGMADRPIEELGGKTPLEYAKTPTLDALAKVSEISSNKDKPLSSGVSPMIAFTAVISSSRVLTAIYSLPFSVNDSRIIHSFSKTLNKFYIFFIIIL